MTRVLSRWPWLALCVLLSACGHSPKKPLPASQQVTAPKSAVVARSAPVEIPAQPARTQPQASDHPNTIICRPNREHRDEDYTPGGLYAPGVSDSAPQGTLDISAISEPVPGNEPRSPFGNRSPYTVLGKHYRVMDSAVGYLERGVASWYGAKFNGRATSSREIYDMCSFSAAHKTLPLPTIARVTNLDNGRSVLVRVNDRGPFHAGRIIDLSYAAAVKLGVDRMGTARVEVQALASSDEVAATSRPMVLAPVQPTSISIATTASDGARRYVQVGSYSDKDNAQRVAERLRDAGIDDVDLDRAEVSGRPVWRVRIGPVRGEKIDRVFAELRRIGLSGARVVSE